MLLSNEESDLMHSSSRRQAIQSIGAAGLSLHIAPNLLAASQHDKSHIKLGLIADLHGGLAQDAEARLDSFLQAMQSAKPDALVQLGDFAFPNPKHQRFADKLNAAHDHVVHVIGNHEFDFGLTRQACYQSWGIDSAYYRYDVAGLRLLVLDGNEKGSPSYDGGYPSYIGERQQEWLVNELESADRPVLILSHQPLAGVAAIDNGEVIRGLLANHAEKIALCINGHSHVDSLLQVQGVTYLHVNSASYYWVGGKKRMAYYREPLFSTMSFNLENMQVEIEGKSTVWKKGDSPHPSSYFTRDNAPSETIVTPQIRSRTLSKDGDSFEVSTSPTHSQQEKGAPELKVLTWNIWGRLNQDPRYSMGGKSARTRTIEVIRNCGADVVALIECYGSAAEIADSLGFFYYTPSPKANLCILSRYPLTNTGTLDGLSPFSFIAATVKLPGGQSVRVYDVWLTSQGRHIVELKNPKLTDSDFCNGDDVRFEMLAKFLKHPDLVEHTANCDAAPVIVAGDFNCVSHLDHTIATRDSGLNHSRVLPIKASKAMYQAGFSDTYREANPDILPSTLGHTWTTVGQEFMYEKNKGFVPVTQNPEPSYRDPYARIDFIYAAGERLETRLSTVVSHHDSRQSRSFPEFPSDHAAVLTGFLVHDSAEPEGN